MRHLIAAGIAAIGLALPAVAAASPPPVDLALAAESEAESKRVAEIAAALLVRLAERVDWPPDAFPEETTPFAICVVGDDPFGAALTRLNGRPFMGRLLSITHFSSVRALRFCPVLFVSESELPRLAQLADALEGSPVLTVSSIEGFCEAGGAIRFVKRLNSLGFEINPNAIERAGLKIDRSLLRLATAVKRH